MKTVFLLLAGVAGGVLGGMGFGGGTLLMPILTFWLNVAPRRAAWINLISFLPTAGVALANYFKEGMIAKKEASFLLAFAFLGLAFAVPLAGKLSERMMKKAFGAFLLLLGASSVLAPFIAKIIDKKRSKDIFHK